jgi:hypothetical protein
MRAFPRPACLERPASLRSRSTAAAAAASAAPTAIRATCQPAMPPVVITPVVAAGTGARGMVPPSPYGTGFAKAAVAAAAEASRPAMTAARGQMTHGHRGPIHRARGGRQAGG